MFVLFLCGLTLDCSCTYFLVRPDFAGQIAILDRRITPRLPTNFKARNAFQSAERRCVRHRCEHHRCRGRFSGIQTQEDHFHTVGLPDAAVRESRDPECGRRSRTRALRFTPTHITINLAPADIKKEGSRLRSADRDQHSSEAYGALQLKDLSKFLLVAGN